MKIIEQAKLPKDTMDRLKFVASAEKGWFDGDQGDPVGDNALFAATRFLELYHKNSTLNRPGIYPLMEGGVNIEWIPPVEKMALFDYDWILDIGNNGEMTAYFFSNNPSLKDYELNFSYNEENIDHICDKIVKKIGDLGLLKY